MYVLNQNFLSPSYSLHWQDPGTTLSSECWTYNAPITDEPTFKDPYGVSKRESLLSNDT